MAKQMNIKIMRNMHLYLGVFFAPMLIFFILSGCWQTFGLHELSKSNPEYRPSKILQSFSQIHKDQRWASASKNPSPSIPFRYLVALMCVGLLITTILGIVLAFKYTHGWVVWMCLFLGVMIPCILIYLGYNR